MLVRYSGSAEDAIQISRNLWSKFNRDRPFQFSFLNVDYNALYKSEEVTETLFSIFAGLTILIACLGLFGLSSYTVQRRNKEFSIRKVFGASSMTLFVTACQSYFWLVFIATLLGCFIAYEVARQWLLGFAYRIELSPVPIVCAGIVGILLALVTIVFQSAKVANVRPSELLRGE